MSWPRFVGFQCQQSDDGRRIIGKILSDNADILRIVELGTGYGGTSLFLGSCICGRGGEVVTIDISPNMEFGYDTWKLLASKYNVSFMQRDVFRSETVQEVSNLIKNYRALVFCDNGDKKREVPLYAETLKKDDLLMAHDYTAVEGGELSPKLLTERTLTILAPYRQEEFATAGDTRILSMKRR